MHYARPGEEESLVSFRACYDNYIGGEWVAPMGGRYFDNISPCNGEFICQVARSDEQDVAAAVHAANQAFASWRNTSAAQRSNLLLQIATRIEDNLEALAVAESWENGKPIRETLTADLPLVVDHFRYFAGCIRAQEGSAAELDINTHSYHFYEPLGVVGQIIPWNFPLLMAAWKLAPALAAGCCVVLKPAEQTPASIMLLMEYIGEILPKGVVNIVNGYGNEAGAALVESPGIAKLAFTGSTEVGRHIYQNAAKRLIPSTVELGGKSPNIFFADIARHSDAFYDKCIEGLVLGFFNQGEVCTCPSRALVHESIYDDFVARVLQKMAGLKQGNPLNTQTQIGAQASREQMDKILSYMEIGKAEGMQLLAGGEAANPDLDCEGGFYVKPTLFSGNNSMRVFQEEIFGPAIGVIKFSTEEEALTLANDTQYGLGAGVWTRDINLAQRMARGIQAGRVWVNCYHAYPAHAAFGGYKQSGIGRETHKMMLSHYQNTKNILINHSDQALGLF